MKENSFTAPTELTIEHHAIMFALLAKYADKECAQKGLDAIGAAVSEYGRERGGRMAKRVLKDGLPLNMQNYLVYGEWTSKPGQMDTRIVQKSPVQITNIHLCEWCTSWKKHNLEKYG
ncbi:MAG: L-2-amino-thiazoline-4-carboxylic acid hydrolase, partial [Hydrogenoanaerobacterium sp.]